MIPSQRMWTIINTETAKEQYVAYRLENLGCEVYLPLMVRFRALSKHVSTNRRTMYELPVLPRQLFAVLPFDLELLDIKHVKGAERGLGGVSLVPDYQMEVFREFVTTERLDAIEAHAKQSRQKPPKRKFQKMTPELLEQWSLRQSNNISKPLD